MTQKSKMRKLASRTLSSNTNSLTKPKPPKLLIYGGSGALGRSIIREFKRGNWNVTSVDVASNQEADLNCNVDDSVDWGAATRKVLEKIEQHDPTGKFFTVVAVAGGWIGGTVKDGSIFENSDQMWSLNVRSAISASHVASRLLTEGGLLVLTGAAPALEGTPEMLAYGVSKAAVHHIVKTLASPAGGLPNDSTAIGILPIVIDTPNNRKWMPKANFSSWTPPEFFAKQILKWSEDLRQSEKSEKVDPGEKPAQGGLYLFKTTNQQTSITLEK